MRVRLPLVAAALVLVACSPSRRDPAPAPPVPKPNMDPARVPRAPARVPVPPLPPEEPLERVVPPDVAAANGWLPLASTGADRFRRAHPAGDGRGVLIAILDTGIDPSVPGLATTIAGDPKLIELRDFSGEGRVALRPVEATGDSVQVGRRRLAGFGRVRALSADGPWYVGTLEELTLGAPPSADINGNGVVGDTLALVVTRATDGWVVLADRDGDGSLAGERPVHDYARAREWLGWAPAGRTPPVGMAANIADSVGAPRLTLVFDLDSHGTHVAGIAAGYTIYGAAGLDGAAPGAQLLGLKISNGARGSVSTTGAILRALDFAVSFAAARRQPLVVNLSFGVGSEVEGSATVDRLIDSVLRRHPEVVLTLSAGNDGPGLSTIGFPGATTRAITVGGTVPPAFVSLSPGRRSRETIAVFSGRGGELAKPDLVAPGIAYSSVPRWNAGDELKQGTSMAAPQVAGVAALILSQLREVGRTADAASMRRALMVTARPVPGAELIEGGRGVPDAEAAYRWLHAGRQGEDVAVAVPGGGGNAGYIVRPSEDAGSGGAAAAFLLRRDGGAPATYTLRTDASWLRPPPRVTLHDTLTLTIPYDLSALAAPGGYSGTVTGWSQDTMAGPAFRLPVTVVRPVRLAGERAALRSATLVPEVGTLRTFFVSDSARPFEVKVSAGTGEHGFAALHEPGGRPYREGGILALAGDAPAVFQVEGENVAGGDYEIVASPAPGQSLTATVEVSQSPVTLSVARNEEARVTAQLLNRSAAPVRATVGLMLRGAEQRRLVVAGGSDMPRLRFVLPGWAREARVEVAMDRAQWGRFTDFGVTLYDTLGRRLATEPLDYALGTLALPLGAETGDRAVALELSPGLADPADTAEWRARVSVRLYAGRDIPARVAAGGADTLVLAPGGTATRIFDLPPLPWALSPEFHPLGALVVHAGGHRWSREAGLPLLTGNTMR